VVPRRYLDFDVLIEASGDRYRAKVLDSPAGQAVREFDLPFSRLELENMVLRITRTVGELRRDIRRLETPERQLVRSFGGRLFDAVFGGTIQGALQSSLNEAYRKEAGLRIRLRLADAPELADLPWEYLYSSSTNQFLSLSSDTPVVRYLDLPSAVRPLTVSLPLHVLVMISSPTDHPQLAVSEEWARLNDALRDLMDRGLVVLTQLERATLSALQRPLRLGQYHIFHFVGHGGFDEQAQDGALLLEDETGKGRLVSGQDLGVMLSGHRSLRLVILNACEGARSSPSDPFAGAAQSLLQQGIPATIAMQFEISDKAAITFAHEFYGAVADGYPIDAALAESRRAIFARGNEVEWATPVLHMRSPDGRVFRMRLPAPGAAVPEEAATAAREAAAREAAERVEREAAEREAAARVEREEREAAEREAAERVVREASKREAAERETAALEAAERETAALEAAERETAALEAAEREAAEVARPASEHRPATTPTAKLAAMALIGGGLLLVGYLAPLARIEGHVIASKDVPLLLVDQAAAWIIALVGGAMLFARATRESVLLMGLLAGVGLEQVATYLSGLVGYTAMSNADPGWGSLVGLIGASLVLSASTISFYRLRALEPRRGVTPEFTPASRGIAVVGAVFMIAAGFMHDAVNQGGGWFFVVPVIVAVAAAAALFFQVRNLASRVFFTSALVAYGSLLGFAFLFYDLFASHYDNVKRGGSMLMRAASGFLLLGAALIAFGAGRRKKGPVASREDRK